MPLLKGRACKSTAKKAIGYITDEKKAAIISSLNCDDGGADYAAQFAATAALLGTEKKYDERKYYHYVLSCDRADGVSAAAHHAYAQQVAARLFENHECVIATHTDTDTVHSHIIINAVNFATGRKIHCTNREYAAQKDLADNLGAELGFTRLNWRRKSNIKRDELERGQAHGQMSGTERRIIARGDSWKSALRSTLDAAKMQCATRAELQDFLSKFCISMPRNTAKSMSFLHPKSNKKSIRSNALGENYTCAAIDAALAANLAKRPKPKIVPQASQIKRNAEGKIIPQGSKLRGEKNIDEER